MRASFELKCTPAPVLPPEADERRRSDRRRACDEMGPARFQDHDRLVCLLACPRWTGLDEDEDDGSVCSADPGAQLLWPLLGMLQASQHPRCLGERK